jgi:sialate O-acetylesterase
MKIKQRIATIILSLILAALQTLSAQLRLPAIFNDHMVLQRDKSVNVWGWSSKGETIEVSFNGQKVKTKSDAEGNWKVAFKPMVYGGPFELSIQGKSEKKVLRDIWIGDVWICSGQSNMEMPVNGWAKVNNFESEIATADHPGIRFFTVEKALSHQPEKDFKGTWQVCSPASVSSFSAVAYFFGRKLNQDLRIPIGLVNSSWGGTNIQTWTSWDEIGKREEYKGQDPKEFSRIETSWQQNRVKYQDALAHDVGDLEKWFMPETNTVSWRKIKEPQSFEQSEIGDADGTVWFRRDIELDATQAGKATSVNLGVIDDKDETFINGKSIGKTNDWYTPRKYAIEPGLLKAGKNTIVVKVTDNAGGGGLVSPAGDLFLTAGNEQIPLSGEWTYRPSATTIQFKVKEKGPNVFPSQLYNAMIAPMIQFTIKGVIWYQGEQNTYEPDRYRSMFPAMIQDWRNKWGYEFPFLWVQLANFMAPAAQPSESKWAKLREAQHMALQLPQTGEAVIIDLGEAGNIHPKNKQDVGYRLALSALKIAYGEDKVYSGPVYLSMEIKEGKAILNFTHVGSGLMAKGDKYGYLKGFAIAGADHHFVWAWAYIDGDKVIVSSEDVKSPVTVRYAWGDNPDDANLYNKEGLPASPFRSDNL